MLAVLASLFATFSQADTVFVVSFTTGELIRYDSTDPAGNIYIAAARVQQIIPQVILANATLPANVLAKGGADALYVSSM